MADTATATPTVAAEGTQTAAEPSMEQQITDLFKGDETAETKTGEETQAPAVKDENQPNELNSQLEEIAKEGDVPVVETAPKLSDDQQQILNAFPSVESAREVAQNSQYFEQLNNAIANRDFETVAGMFEPSAFEDFKDHIYTKFGTEFIDRWIADKEGTAPIHRGMTVLERRVQQLEAEKAAQAKQSTQAKQQQERAQLTQNYVGHISGLFDKINFSANDRRWVFADINNRVAADPNVRAQISSGNVKAVNKIFSDAVKEYSTKDQAQHAQKETTIAAQEKHKPLQSPGAVAVQSDKLTDDVIAQAPKSERAGLRDRKMAQELNDLFRK